MTSKCAAPALPNVPINSTIPRSIVQRSQNNGTVTPNLRFGDCVSIQTPGSGNSGYFITLDDNRCIQAGTGSYGFFQAGEGTARWPIVAFTLLNPAAPYEYGAEIMSGDYVYVVMQNVDNPLLSTISPQNGASICGYSYLSMFHAALGEYWPTFRGADDDSEESRALFVVGLNANDYYTGAQGKPTKTPIPYGTPIYIGNPEVSSDGFIYNNMLSGNQATCGVYSACNQSDKEFAHAQFVVVNSEGVVPQQLTLQQACPGNVKCIGCVTGSTTTCTNGCTAPSYDVSSGTCTVTCPSTCTTTTKGACASGAPITMSNCTPPSACVPSIAGGSSTDPDAPAKCANAGQAICSADGATYVCADLPTTSTTLYVVLAIAGLVVVALILAMVFSFRKTFGTSK